jgi:hypothetical protein
MRHTATDEMMVWSLVVARIFCDTLGGCNSEHSIADDGDQHVKQTSAEASQEKTGISQIARMR